MNIPTDLEPLGRAFLASLIDRLGHHGVGAVLMLLAVEMKTAGQREPSGRDDGLNS